MQKVITTCEKRGRALLGFGWVQFQQQMGYIREKHLPLSVADYVV